MSGLLRYTQKLFGINAGTNQMSKYGSRIQAPPGNRYSGSTITPALVQELSAFLEGQYAAMAGAKSPFIPDHNSLFYLAFYQLSYLLTRGIPEWDSGTTYNTNDFCKVGSVTYYSLIDSNTNNDPASNPSDWKSNALIAPTQQIFTSGSGTYTPTGPTKPLYIRVQLAGGCGGGQGSGYDAAGGGNGGNGGNSTFGTSLLTANGGQGGNKNQSIGGTANFTAGTGTSSSGQNGGGETFIKNSGVITMGLLLPGSRGGVSLLSRRGGAGGSADIDAAAGDFASAGGGGAGGGFLDVIITNPASSYPYSVGSAGSAGAAGPGSSGGNPGEAGDFGILIVTEYYQ